MKHAMSREISHIVFHKCRDGSLQFLNASVVVMNMLFHVVWKKQHISRSVRS